MFRRIAWLFSHILAVLMMLSLLSCGGGGSSSSVSPEFPSSPESGADNADLDNLSAFFGLLSPAFDPDITDYNLIVPESSTSVSFDVNPVDGQALLLINNVEQDPGLASVVFDSDLNTMIITVDVTSEDGSTQRRYTLSVTRSDQNDNTNLSQMALSDATLTPSFSSKIDDYLATVPFLNNRVLLTAVTEDDNAQMTLVINGERSAFSGRRSLDIDEGTSEVLLEVRAEDLITLRNYRIVFSRASANALAESDYVKADDASTGDRFGYALDIDETTLAVGAISADAGMPGSGAVYVYNLNQGERVLSSVVVSSNADAEDLFGWSVDVDGDTLVVGAPGEDSTAEDPDSNNLESAGAVYVFQRQNGEWHEHGVLKASNADAGDLFGQRVSLWGRWLAVAAVEEDSILGDVNDNTASGAGAVYLFEREDDAWIQRQFLKAPNLSINDNFGESLALTDTVLAVGAPREDSDGSGNVSEENDFLRDAGAVYIYQRDDNQWFFHSMIKAENSGEDNAFGQSVTILDDIVIVGAPQENSDSVGVDSDSENTGAEQSGAVYIYRKINDDWRQTSYVKASNTYPYARFGQSLAAYENTLLVGSPGESSASTEVNGDQTQGEALSAGAAYVFKLENDNWQQATYIKASNAERGDFFGFDLGLTEEVVVVAAPSEDGDAEGNDSNEYLSSGAVYLFDTDN